ncbi:sensor histidine kinase [Cloacibacterium normanense]|uniref:sensor histidine kinase n=1 Tax=Cloacibacterium normanense TaxID=237258 RepID=UPI0021A8A217|nr:histidine kinase [Cloacibacterium normanense]
MIRHLPDAVLLVLIFAIVILLMFVGFVILVVMVYRKKQMVFIKEKLLQKIEYRNQILEKELEIQKKIQEERERISHDMHDDLGAGISALKLQAEFLKQKINEQHLKEDINDLLKTSEEMNLSMREMLWSLNSNNDTLGNFIQYLTIYSENFFKKTKIEIKIDKKVDHPDKQLNAETRRHLFLCAKEALNNIYKHSQARTLSVFFLLEQDIFTLEIIDNGIGIQNKKKSGNGLYNMERRMNSIEGSFKIKPSKKGLHLLFQVQL